MIALGHADMIGCCLRKKKKRMTSEIEKMMIQKEMEEEK